MNYLKHLLMITFNRKYRQFNLKYILAEKYQSITYNYEEVQQHYNLKDNKWTSHYSAIY